MSQLSVGSYIPLTFDNKELILSILEQDFEVAVQLNSGVSVKLEDPADRLSAILDGYTEGDWEVVVPDNDDDIRENILSVVECEPDELEEPCVIVYRHLADIPTGLVLVGLMNTRDFIQKVGVIQTELEELGLTPKIMMNDLEADCDNDEYNC